MYIECNYNGEAERVEGMFHGFYQRDNGELAWPVALFEDKATGKIHELNLNRGELSFVDWEDA